MGNNSYPYFLESLSIGIGETDNDIDTWRDPVDCAESPVVSAGECSLLGNDSGCSELRGLSKDGDSATFANDPKEAKALCLLSGEYLVCEIKGASAFCLRLGGSSGVEVVLEVTGGAEGVVRKAKVEENDVLLVVTFPVSAEDVAAIAEKVQRKNMREVSIRKYLKTMAEYVSEEISAIMIAARILKKI